MENPKLKNPVQNSKRLFLRMVMDIVTLSYLKLKRIIKILEAQDGIMNKWKLNRNSNMNPHAINNQKHLIWTMILTSRK